MGKKIKDVLGDPKHRFTMSEEARERLTDRDREHDDQDRKSARLKATQQNDERNLSVPNYVRTDKLEAMTRGLQLPKGANTMARLNFYSAREAFVKQAIALNYTDGEICTVLKITGKQLQTIKSKVYNNELQVLNRMTQLEHFVEYKLKTMEVIKDLDVLVEKFRVGNNLMGLASALKSKQDAIERLKGATQEVGLMDKKADEIRIVGGVNMRELTNDELLDVIAKGNVVTQKLLLPANVLPIKKKAH